MDTLAGRKTFEENFELFVRKWVTSKRFLKKQKKSQASHRKSGNKLFMSLSCRTIENHINEKLECHRQGSWRTRLLTIYWTLQSEAKTNSSRTWKYPAMLQMRFKSRIPMCQMHQLAWNRFHPRECWKFEILSRRMWLDTCRAHFVMVLSSTLYRTSSHAKFTFDQNFMRREPEMKRKHLWLVDEETENPFSVGCFERAKSVSELQLGGVGHKLCRRIIVKYGSPLNPKWNMVEKLFGELSDWLFDKFVSCYAQRNLCRDAEWKSKCFWGSLSSPPSSKLYLWAPNPSQFLRCTTPFRSTTTRHQLELSKVCLPLPSAPSILKIRFLLPPCKQHDKVSLRSWFLS